MTIMMFHMYPEHVMYICEIAGFKVSSPHLDQPGVVGAATAAIAEQYNPQFSQVLSCRLIYFHCFYIISLMQTTSLIFRVYLQNNGLVNGYKWTRIPARDVVYQYLEMRWCVAVVVYTIVCVFRPVHCSEHDILNVEPYKKPLLIAAVWFFVTGIEFDKGWQKCVLTNVAVFPQVIMPHITPDTGVMDNKSLRF